MNPPSKSCVLKCQLILISLHVTWSPLQQDWKGPKRLSWIFNFCFWQHPPNEPKVNGNIVFTNWRHLRKRILQNVINIQIKKQSKLKALVTPKILGQPYKRNLVLKKDKIPCQCLISIQTKLLFFFKDLNEITHHGVI